MAVKTVNVQGFEAAMALGATAKTKAVNDGGQSFGDVLSKAGDKITDRSQTTVQSAEPKKPETNTNSEKSEAPKENLEQTDTVEKTTELSDAVENETVDNAKPANPVDEKVDVLELDGEADKMTTEQIADALAQIIEQIKELLGVSDEELLAGMESVGIEPADLLGTDSMAQLLTAIAGEGEAISFVTNEELYTALQELTATVETVSSQLMEDMGLTQEEFDALLEKLAQTENPVSEELIQSTDSEEMPKMTDVVNKDAALFQEEAPTVVIEENTKPQQTKMPENQPEQNQQEELQENQQENSAQGTVKVQPQKSEHDEHGQEKSDNFNGQQGAVQNFGEKFNETPQVSAQTATGYASGNVDSILKQLADFVKIVKNENLTEMELQLHPASLGTVNVSLVTKGGAVTAEFTTQNETVRAAIESQVSQLITNLEEQGVKVEAVEVSVASHEMERNLEENSQNDQNRQEQEEKQRVSGTRRNSINFNSFADDDELAEEMQEANDATRIAMELMAVNGNSMDLMA